MLPEPIKKFIEVFSSLPAIGPRQAHRLAFYIKNLDKGRIREIANAVQGLEDISICKECFLAFEEADTKNPELCLICTNPDRDASVIAIVEKETDLMSLENARNFSGRYLILGHLKKDGFLTDEQRKRLGTLSRPDNKKLKEIIIALSPTTYGDINTESVSREIKNLSDKITSLGRGIPTGGEIEFADEETLGSALDNRA
jgi:recombination protein RecR